MQVIKSQIDESVNFITPISEGQYLEARYVRRNPEYFVCYLSSQTACKMGCKFCHLSASGQTNYRDVTYTQFTEQVDSVLEHYKTQPPAKIVHYNFMSRGEALDNPVVNSWLLNSLITQLRGFNSDNEQELIPKFNISTIMPKTFKDSLALRFFGYSPTIYYSLYSMKKEFRDKWLPGAMNPYTALEKLKEYQDISKKIIKLHWAFIEGENDSIKDIELITDALHEINLTCEFNLVRYNPYTEIQGKEPLEERLRGLLGYLSSSNNIVRSKMISRVGMDCYASCGMFCE